MAVFAASSSGCGSCAFFQREQPVLHPHPSLSSARRFGGGIREQSRAPSLCLLVAVEMAVYSLGKNLASGLEVEQADPPLYVWGRNRSRAAFSQGLREASAGLCVSPEGIGG